MIDTDKYEGYAREEWHRDSNDLWFHRNGEDIQIADILIRGDGDERYYEDVFNARLITDAPLLLAEVKRLRGLLKITAQSYLDCVRAEDMLGEVSVKKEYETCKEIGDVIGATINDEYYFTYEKESEREMMVNALIERDIAWIEEGFIYGDRELLWSVLSGDGCIPYNQLTDEQVIETYTEAFDEEGEEE